MSPNTTVPKLESVSEVLPSALPQQYALHAYSTAVKIGLRSRRDILPADKTERLTQECLVYHVGPQQKLFIFNFGAVVFFNVPREAHSDYLARLGLVARLHSPTTQPLSSDELAEDAYTVRVQPGAPQVSFNEVVVPDLDIAKIHLVAQLLAQSSALETIEWEVEEFLARSERLTMELQAKRWRRTIRREVMKLLAEGLTARHLLVNRLALLQEPEKTWEKEELYRLYLGLWETFDIDERIEILEKNLKLSTEVSELLLNILDARRSELLEIIIIALIFFEIVKSFIG